MRASRVLAAAAALLSVCGAARALSARQCAEPGKTVACTNCDFAADKDKILDGPQQRGDKGATANTYMIMCPTGWSCKSLDQSSGAALDQTAQRVRVAFSGAKPWGSLKTPSGNPFAILQRRTTQISRSFANLDAKSAHVLQFWAAERPGYGSSELISVSINGKKVATFNPASGFAEHGYTFFPAPDGNAEVMFINDTPGNADVAVFVADVSVAPVRDCGTGATCTEPLPPYTEYRCSCDNEHTGATVTGGKASCANVAASGKELRDVIGQVKDQVVVVQAEVKELAAKAKGLQDGVGAVELASQATDETVKELKAKVEQCSSAGDVDALKAQMTEVQGQLAALLKALQAEPAAVRPGTSTSPEPKPDGTVAQIVSDNGSIDLVVQDGRRVTVNGDAVLTADDVAQVVADAVASALQTVGKAIE